MRQIGPVFASILMTACSAPSPYANDHCLHYFLPKAEIRIARKPSLSRPGHMDLTMSKNLLPDTGRIFRLCLPADESAAFLVKQKITLTDKGLLSRLPGTGTSRVPKDALSTPKSYRLPLQELNRTAFDEKFDPLDPAAVAAAASTVAAAGFRLGIIVPPASSTSFPRAWPVSHDVVAPPATGLLEHPWIKIEIILDLRPHCPRIVRECVMVPDVRRVMSSKD
jgi:hypothetical protein